MSDASTAASWAVFASSLVPNPVPSARRRPGGGHHRGTKVPPRSVNYRGRGATRSRRFMARPKTSTGASSVPDVAALRAMGIYQLSDGRWMAKVKIGVNPDTHQPIFARPKAADL